MPAGMARLEVTFMVDADGILRVSAREETTGQEAAIEVKPSYGLTDDEVERMLLDSFAHAEDDVKARLLAEQRVEADGIVAAARRRCATRPSCSRRASARRSTGARRRRGGARRAAITRRSALAIEALDHASKPFATRRMNRALRAGFPAAAPSTRSMRGAPTLDTAEGRGRACPRSGSNRTGSRSRCRSAPASSRPRTRRTRRSAPRAAASARARPATST